MLSQLMHSCQCLWRKILSEERREGQKECSRCPFLLSSNNLFNHKHYSLQFLGLFLNLQIDGHVKAAFNITVVSGKATIFVLWEMYWRRQYLHSQEKELEVSCGRVHWHNAVSLWHRSIYSKNGYVMSWNANAAPCTETVNLKEMPYKCDSLCSWVTDQ